MLCTYYHCNKKETVWQEEFGRFFTPFVEIARLVLGTLNKNRHFARAKWQFHVLNYVEERLRGIGA